MRTITVSMRTILRAVRESRSVSDDWQGAILEILRVPAIAKRWRELNPRYRGLELVRHAGLPMVGGWRELAGDNPDWASFAGYTLIYDRFDNGRVYGWNSVRSDYYAHSASTAWNGVRRETIHRFAESLWMIALGHDHPDHRTTLTRAGIELTASKTTMAILAATA